MFSFNLPDVPLTEADFCRGSFAVRRAFHEEPPSFMESLTDARLRTAAQKLRIKAKNS